MKYSHRMYALLLYVLPPLLCCCKKVSDRPLQDSLLRVGYYVSGKIDGLNPIVADSALLHRLMFNGLVRVNDQLEIVPDLAESWEVSGDGLIWTFHLRKGIIS